MSPSTLPASAYEALELPESTVKTLTTQKPNSSPASAASPNLLQNSQQPEERLAPNESSITLYSELLLHIRTVTLFASLRTVHTRETKAKLSTDGSRITVTHEGQSASIRLPIKVEGGGDAALCLPAQPPSKDLTLRLQIEEREGSDLLGTLQSEERKANIVPWDGVSLRNLNTIEINCKSCKATVVPINRVGQWRDLPNENWAEMMDFWHCHKPDEHHLHDHTHEEVVGKKGYAAGNRLKATEGVSFVDLASFLLKEQDCKGAEISPNSQTSDSSLRCKRCGHNLGILDSNSDGWRIWKWCIGISANPSMTPATYTIQKWISARLLFLIDNTGVRKFHVHYNTNLPTSSSSSSSAPSLLLWVFTPDLYVSTSISLDTHCSPTRSMKIFYQHQTWASPKAGEPESASVEEVEFPRELYEELDRVLGKSQKLLPGSARKFQGWQVGLLERFDVGDVMKPDEAETSDPLTEENVSTR